jgi:hypothetical protein
MRTQSQPMACALVSLLHLGVCAVVVRNSPAAPEAPEFGHTFSPDYS